MKITLRRSKSDPNTYIVLGLVWLMLGSVQYMRTSYFLSVLGILAGILLLFDGFWRRRNPVAFIENGELHLLKDAFIKKRIPFGEIAQLDEMQDGRYQISLQNGKTHKIGGRSVLEEDLPPFLEAIRNGISSGQD